MILPGNGSNSAVFCDFSRLGRQSVLTLEGIFLCLKCRGWNDCPAFGKLCPVSSRVVIVPDKFKGTLTAMEAARAIARGWRRVRPGDRLELIPMSDGGDGFGETIALQEKGRRRRVKTVNAAGQSIWAPWWWVARSRTAIIETAKVVGLAPLPPDKFHPFDLDTYGLGILISKILEREIVARLLIGLGGSATNDGGFGMARSLGWRFRGKNREWIVRWTDLTALESIVFPTRKAKRLGVVAAVDVQNPLLGAKGASRIYGPQKGLRERDMPLAESCLARLSECFQKQTGRPEAHRPGAGAAGGLGFGCYAFLDGKSCSGFEMFAKSARLEQRLSQTDLVLTGEGAIDQSSLMGKGVGQVAKWCRDHQKPCIALGGTALQSSAADFWKLYAIVPEVAEKGKALEKPRLCLTQLAEKAAREWEERAESPKKPKGERPLDSSIGLPKKKAAKPLENKVGQPDDEFGSPFRPRFQTLDENRKCVVEG